VEHNGLYGKCSRCGHVFLVARLPMNLHAVAALAGRASCAECGATNGIVVAPPPAETEGGP